MQITALSNRFEVQTVTNTQQEEWRYWIALPALSTRTYTPLCNKKKSHEDELLIKCSDPGCKTTYVQRVTTDDTGGADKSLARPGRKQATAAEEFVVYISHLLS
jgi:hypothetical protein